MTNDIQFNPSLNAAVVAQENGTSDHQAIQQGKPLAPILGGDNVKVTSGAVTDLEKLVARLKNEEENQQMDMMRLRLSAVRAALDTANVALSQEQAKAFDTITEQETYKAGLEAQLKDLYAAYGIEAGADADAVMEAKIKSLEQAVERAIQEGKDHNAAVDKAKKQLERDQAELERLENAETKDEAAIATARNAVETSQGTYNAAAALASGDAKKIADAQSALAKANEDAGKMSAARDGIAEADAKIASALKIIGSGKIGEVAQALAAVADGVESPENHESESDREKEEKKEIANDPLNAIRAALDKIDEAILQTIDENQVVKA